MRLSDTDVYKTEKLFAGAQYPSWKPLGTEIGTQCSVLDGVIRI